MLFCSVLAAVGAKPPYVVNGVSFNSADAVFTAYRQGWDAQLQHVQPGQYYGGSVLLVLPPDSALISPKFIGAYRSDFDQDSRQVYQRWFALSAQVTLEAINKAGLFDSATLTQVNGYWKYASDYGYRYVLVYVGRPDGMRLSDTETRAEVVLTPAGEGLAGLMNGLEQALDQLARQAPPNPGGGAATVAEARPSTPRPDSGESMHYDDQTRRGWVAIKGRGLAARNSLLQRIAEICATKNKLLVSDDLAQARGAFKVLDEELADGVLKVTFEALY